MNFILSTTHVKINDVQIFLNWLKVTFQNRIKMTYLAPSLQWEFSMSSTKFKEGARYVIFVLFRKITPSKMQEENSLSLQSWLAWLPVVFRLSQMIVLDSISKNLCTTLRGRYRRLSSSGNEFETVIVTCNRCFTRPHPSLDRDRFEGQCRFSLRFYTE